MLSELFLFLGILDRKYNSSFRQEHQLILSIMKEFGFGKNIMETRIQHEVAALVDRVREIQGQPFWPDKLVTSSVLSVILSILIGESQTKESAVDELILVIRKVINGVMDAVDIDVFPLLRFLPSYQRSTTKTLEYNRKLFDFFSRSACIYYQIKIFIDI